MAVKEGSIICVRFQYQLLGLQCLGFNYKYNQNETET